MATPRGRRGRALFGAAGKRTSSQENGGGKRHTDEPIELHYARPPEHGLDDGIIYRDAHVAAERRGSRISRDADLADHGFDGTRILRITNR